MGFSKILEQELRRLEVPPTQAAPEAKQELKNPLKVLEQIGRLNDLIREIS